MNVSIIGCGKIGMLISDGIKRGEAGETTLISAFDRHADRAALVAARTRAQVATSIQDILRNPRVELVVEAASITAVRELGPRILHAGKDLLILSSGALLLRPLLKNLLSVARQRGVKIYVPSGAAAGMDAIKAGRVSGLTSVSVELRKTPGSWKEFMKDFGGKKIDRGRRQPITLVESKVDELVSSSPGMFNSVAAISLAGAGPIKTAVRVVRDPSLARNVTRIHAVTKSWEVLVESRNDWSAKILEGTLTVSSVLSKLRDLSGPLEVGS
ncbi:MAG: DUF108 domain-containing protein [Thaumarchaeota archaeon]|nr:DUF108 domain-containing protein [Nitrososphaerota archaeon]